MGQEAVLVMPENALLPRTTFVGGRNLALIPPVTHRLKTGETVVIRSAEPDDAAALLKCAREVIAESEFEVTLPAEFNLTVEQEQETLRDHRDDPNKLCLVVWAGESLIGDLFFQAGVRQRKAHCGMLNLGIVTAWQRKGIGTLLLQTCLDWARWHPRIEKVALLVVAPNTAALALYRKMGFIEEGRRFQEIRLGPGQYVDDILMYQWVK